MNGFLEILGAVAAALAVVSGLGQGVRILRLRRSRRRLRDLLDRLVGQDAQLRRVVVAVDEQLWEGPGWTGWAIWPESIRDYLFELRATARTTERLVAEIRAIWADGPLARVRDDLEAIADTMREVSLLYARGAVGFYRRHQGQGQAHSVTGRGQVAILDNESIERMLQLRRRAEVLFRTAAYQLQDRDGEFAEHLAALWPVYEREASPMPEAQADLRDAVFEP